MHVRSLVGGKDKAEDRGNARKGREKGEVLTFRYSAEGQHTLTAEGGDGLGRVLSCKV